MHTKETIDITALDSSDEACDQFIKRMPDGKLEHLPAWSIMIEQTFGHKTFYLVARKGNTISGVLPLTQVRSRLFGNRMVSQAFSNYGGPLTDGPDAAEALYNCAVELAGTHGCESIEFRNLKPLPYDLESRQDKISMFLALPPDPDQLWHSLGCKVRNQVRKGRKSGLSIVNGAQDLLDEFYNVWTVRMRELGTPCYPRRLFLNILKMFPDEASVFLVRLGKRTVGGALVYCYKGFTQIRWGAALVEYNKIAANTLLYWSVMKHYCLDGASCFDFGRSTVNSSQYRFKKRWGARPVQLYYQYWTAPGHKLSLVNPDNPKYRKKVNLWKKMPLWVTRLAGPSISRSLP